MGPGLSWEECPTAYPLAVDPGKDAVQGDQAGVAHQGAVVGILGRVGNGIVGRRPK